MRLSEIRHTSAAAKVTGRFTFWSNTSFQFSQFFSFSVFTHSQFFSLLGTKNQNMNIVAGRPATDSIQLELIKAWLFKIGEPEEDHFIVLEKCKSDPEAKAYFFETCKRRILALVLELIDKNTTH
jgi:hypothetical protein